MRYFINIISVVLMTSMFNCSKSGNSISIAGRWTVNSWTVTGCRDSANNFSMPFECPGSPTKWCYIYTFNTNGTCVVGRTATSTETDTGTYSVTGNFVSIVFTGSSDLWNFVLVNNTLTFSMSDPTNGCLHTFVLTK